MEKIKTYVLTLSKFFPSTHIRKGEPTSFRDAFNAGQVFNRGSACLYRHPKKHTIRSNYPLWLKRITEVQAGKAVLSVRQWTGKPYRSPQEEIAILTNEDGLGIQELKKISLEDYKICSEPAERDPYPPYRERLHPRKHWQRKPYWLRTRSNPKKKGYH